MYRQVLTPTFGDISFPIPPSWYGQEIEVIAFPITEPRQETTVDLVAKRRQKLIENGKKYSFNSKEIGFKFNRDEANNYDE
jgi:hypothetical protein